MLKDRLLTALLGAPLLLVVAWLGEGVLALAVAVLNLLGLMEFRRLLRRGWGGAGPPFVPEAWALLAPLTAWRFGGTGLLEALVVGLILVTFLALRGGGGVWTAHLSLLYPATLLSFLVLLRERWGGEALFLLLLLVWTFDTLSYFGGRLWGRRPLAPAVSPKKTWEGAFAGLAAALALGWVLGPWAWLSRAEGLLLAGLTSFLSLAGDLWESSLKREAGAKDSGDLLPGHGGVLDRFDSLAFAALGAYYFFVLASGGR